MKLFLFLSALIARSACIPVTMNNEDELVQDLQRATRSDTFGQFGASTSQEGDPFSNTFDGMKMEYSGGGCKYDFCHVCHGPLQNFWSVTVKNKAVFRNGRQYAYSDHLDMEAYNHFVSLQQMCNVKIDGELYTQARLLKGPVYLHDGKMEVGCLGPNEGAYIRCNELAMNATFAHKGMDGRHVAKLALMSSDELLRDLRVYRGNLCGLCGNFDGDKMNDLIPKNGDQIASPVEVSNSHIIGHECAFGE